MLHVGKEKEKSIFVMLQFSMFRKILVLLVDVPFQGTECHGSYG